MHIKQISISNFRSFQNQEEIEPFSPHTNAVVGRNGSGKSNLFDAVQFVLLAPRFANLRQEERQAILHEGSGAAAVNAFVEIIFDNSDHRFALEASDEVVLRRTIGLKKDEFFLNRKRANKQEVQSLLEGAGFSKSNPYFIVQQGKIQDLCTMSDKDRLVLLKEVAGTTVYDEKKAESLAKMQENAISIEKIQDILSDINERLEELESEKEELTNYQQMDRQRRVIEYTLYDKELRKARQSLDNIEHDRAEHVEVISQHHQAAKETHDSIQEVEGILKSKSNVLRRSKMALQGLEQDVRAAVTTAAKLDLEIKDGKALLENLKEQSSANKNELQRVEKDIAQAQRKLEQLVEPAYEKAVKDLQSLTDRRDDGKRQIDALYAKQGRGKQFATKEERDAFLQESIQELQTTKQAKEELLGQQQDTLSNLRRAVQKEAQDIEKLTQDITEKDNALQGLIKTIDQKKKDRLEVVDRRKRDQRRTEELREQVKEARENFHGALGNFRKVMPRATSMGIEALKSIVEQERLTEDQYFGMLMDNFNLKEEKYQAAVEVAAQNSLFHVIVDTDDTAARLMKRLEDGKLGRVTFLPLNQLVVDRVQYPESDNGVLPLLETSLEYDPKVERAMQHVFGKKLLANNSDLAAEWSAKVKMDTITLDGDLCSRKGALTGGYVDATKSRLRAHSEKKATQEELRSLDREYQTVNRQCQQADQEATNVMSELQLLESKQAELTNRRAEKQKAMERLSTRIENQKNQCGKLEKEAILSLQKEVASIQADISRLEEELGTELIDALSSSDRQLISDLKNEQTELKPEIEIQTENLAKASLERQTLLSLLNDNLLKRRRELTDASTLEPDGNRRPSRGGLSSGALQQEQKLFLEEQERELDQATRIKNGLEAQLEKARQDIQTLQESLVKAKNELEHLKSVDEKNRSNLEEANDKAERLLTKRSICISKRETYMRKIAELGSLPPSTELDKLVSKNIKQLMEALESVNKKLKKYSHVNKKAFDQYVNFNEQREQLLKRKVELDKEAQKVNELIESLDQQKDEAINRTFRGVSKHFKDVFSELVPLGAGELVMRSALAGDAGEATEDDEGDEETGTEEESDLEPTPKKKKTKGGPKSPDVALYRGIGIKVRFSAVGENYIMSQLSGGQKALVAMALIFAIQRCDPAPFYLFDELDQALDSTYRSAVARMIQKQSRDKENPTQFIVSTFRPELVETAHKCYGISHQNKETAVHVLSKKNALGFVASLLNEEEAVGDVTVTRKSKGSAPASRKRKTIAAEYQSEEEDDDEEEEKDMAGEEEEEDGDDMAEEGDDAAAESDDMSVEGSE